jgi:hypothetical protein
MRHRTQGVVHPRVRPLQMVDQLAQLTTGVQRCVSRHMGSRDPPGATPEQTLRGQRSLARAGEAWGSSAHRIAADSPRARASRGERRETADRPFARCTPDSRARGCRADRTPFVRDAASRGRASSAPPRISARSTRTLNRVAREAIRAWPGRRFGWWGERWGAEQCPCGAWADEGGGVWSPVVACRHESIER